MSSPDIKPAARPLTTPIGFFVFNRPDYTRRVLEVIRQAKPQEIFLVADGPRPNHPGESALCQEVRETLEEGINWPCAVRRDFSEKNLGCAERISSGLRWVFDQVDRAIILEDDCLPDPTFFTFSQELLARYEDDPKIGMIAGTNYRSTGSLRSESYFFSRHGSIWGWATWRRAFAGYEATMADWRNSVKPGDLGSHWGDWRSRLLHRTMFDLCREGAVKTWDIPWVFHLARNRMLSIVPRVNLVTNIGVSGTRGRGGDRNNNLPTQPMTFPLNHPEEASPETQYDRYVSKRHRIFRDWLRARWIFRFKSQFNLRSNPS
jgi:hypothetical protein